MSIQTKKMYGMWQGGKNDTTNELYVNVGIGFADRGGLVPWGWLEMK